MHLRPEELDLVCASERIVTMVLKNKLLLLFLAFISVFVVFFWLNSSDSDQDKLRIYTYSSFLSHYGPGPELKKQFEQTCNCEVEFVDAGDAGLILQRLSLNPKDHVDMVIGLDYLTLNKAKNNYLWRKHNLTQIELAQDFLKPTDYFMPYDWSPMTFIYRKSEVETLPSKLDDLTGPEFHKRFLFQDPRSSTPGQQFLFWTLKEYGEQGFQVTKQLLNNIKKLSPSWSASYGYFQQKKASFVFSYLTSLIYHWKVDKDFNYQAINFDHPHPVQVEYFAITQKCIQCELAESFAKHMMTKPAQKTLAEKNYMFPAIKDITLSEEYSKLPNLKTYSLQDYEFFQEDFTRWIKTWETLIRK